MSHLHQLLQLTSEVDRIYQEIYDVAPLAAINEHVYINDQVDSTALADTQVFELEDTLHISVRFSPDLLTYFEDHPCPSKSLTSHNLGLLAIVAEEVSHFQCIVHAAVNDSPVSRFDLELQSEFDKFLIAAKILRSQVGDAHPMHLARLLFDSSKIYQEPELYNRVNGIAASWWWSQLNLYGNSLFESKTDLINSLKKLRHIHGEAKLAGLDELKIKQLSRSA